MTPFRTLVSLVLLVAASMLPALGAAVAGPVVVVYPLTFAGGAAGNEVGSNVSLIIAQKLADGGGLTVVPPVPGTDRAHYLDAAQNRKADYYITGFLQSIGPDVSMIVQVVSTYSGSVVFSTTATIRTFGDAGLQAEPLREAILRHAGRGLAPLDAPAQANAAPSSAPTNGPGVNLTRALRRHEKSTPAPSASPGDAGLTPVSQYARPATSASPAPVVSPVATRTAAAVAVAGTPATAMVIDASGSESADLLARASDSLVSALQRSHVRAGRLSIANDDLRKNAASVCRANVGTTRFYSPMLVLGHDESGSLAARLSVDAIGCDGVTIATQAATGSINARGGYVLAIDRATAKIAPLLAGP